MPEPVLIVVAGPLCTGKTTLARQLARDLALPFVNKDDIKELLFDSLGWSDRQWSKQLGIASYALLYCFIEAQLAVGRSLVVESNFRHPADTERFVALRQRYAFTPVQIQCFADGEALIRRFRRRADSGARHPGHVDHLNYAELGPILRTGRHEPLEPGDPVVEVDTTDFAVIDYAGLLRQVQATFDGDRRAG